MVDFEIDEEIDDVCEGDVHVCDWCRCPASDDDGDTRDYGWYGLMHDECYRDMQMSHEDAESERRWIRGQMI